MSDREFIVYGEGEDGTLALIAVARAAFEGGDLNKIAKSLRNRNHLIVPAADGIEALEKARDEYNFQPSGPKT